MSLTMQLPGVLTVDVDQDTLSPLTVVLLWRLLNEGKAGRDALAVYQHLRIGRLIRIPRVALEKLAAVEDQ